MYQIHKTDTGYSFKTINGTVYEVYFNSFGQFATDAFESHHEKLSPGGDIYYFGIERMTEKKGSRSDMFVKRTIAYILFVFFTQYREAIILFNYTSGEKRINAKRKLFKDWYDEYSIHSSYQFYQHDYSDDMSICCLYMRRGGVKFDKFKSDIENFIKNMEAVFDESKLPTGND